MSKFILLIALFVLIGCEKESEITGAVFYKGQLQCSGDNWARGTDEETIRNMTNYLTSKGIVIEKAELTAAQTDRVFCAACTCPTGRTYVITVSSGSEEELKKEGFSKK